MKETIDYLEDFYRIKGIEQGVFDSAVEIYRTCRKRGKTIRKSTDCLIAAQAEKLDFGIFHKDRDFDQISKVFKSIRILSAD